MSEPAVFFSYLVTYGFIVAYLVLLARRDRRLRTLMESSSADRPDSE